MTDPLIDHFVSQWKFLRGLTEDLLESIIQGEMVRSPKPCVGPWWKQFRHVGRVQENYLDAIDSGTVKFGFEGTTYRGRENKEEIQKYLERLDDRLSSLLEIEIRQPDIDWFGKKMPFAKHLLCLADHELLHWAMGSVRPAHRKKVATELESLGGLGYLSMIGSSFQWVTNGIEKR